MVKLEKQTIASFVMWGLPWGLLAMANLWAGVAGMLVQIIGLLWMWRLGVTGRWMID